MSEPSDWENIDRSITDVLLSKIAESVECSVCSDIMIVPVLSSCGHTFCYECVTSWFENKVTCPTCRHELEVPPILNVQLKDISNNLIETLIEHGDEDEKQNLIKRKEESNNIYQNDSKNETLYGTAFKNVLTLVDKSDGVPRCGNCHWEAHGSECLHCGAVFRIPRDDDYESAEAYDEDQLEVELYGAEDDAYDSNDSFIDGRELNDINEDLDNNNDILSDMDTNSNHESWQGFGRLAHNDHEIHDLSDRDSFEDLDEFQESHSSHHQHNLVDDSLSEVEDYSDDDLHTAIDNFNGPIEIDLEEDDDYEPRRRPVVINISDDE